MTIINKCQAKDPATCRYHHQGAGAEAFASWKEAEGRIEKAKEAIARGDDNAHQDFMTARFDADNAEETYYATTDGLISLLMKIDASTNPTDEYTLQLKLESAKYHIRELEHSNEIDNKAGGPLIPAKVSPSYVPPSITRGGNDLWPESKGSNYDPQLTNVAIKSRIAKDIKEAQKNGYLPKHVQLRLTTNSGSLGIKILGVPNEQIYNDPEEQRRSDLTPNARELKARLSTIVNSYNSTQYDTIEGRRNSSNFWESIDYETDWEKSRREAKASK